MLAALEVIEARYLELEVKSGDPMLLADGAAAAALMKEYRHLAPTVEKLRAWRQAKKDLADALELLPADRVKTMSTQDLAAYSKGKIEEALGLENGEAEA